MAENTGKPDEVTDLMELGNITGTIERPKSLGDSLVGTEDIGANEVKLPRLAIAQGLSPQMVPNDTQYIKDLALFDMFNDVTREVYGKGPITFVPVRRDLRRMEFIPRSEGGGIKDMDVPPNDPRLKWTVENGARVPPRATLFVEFVILLLRPGKAPEPIVLSIKSTNKYNRRASDNLTTYIKLRNAAIYAGLYTIDTTIPAQNTKGTFGVPTIRNAGFIPRDTPAGLALFNHAAKFAASLTGKVLVVDREEGTTDDIDDSTGSSVEPPVHEGDTGGM